MIYPEILKSISGEKIDSTEKWEKWRRTEILELFRKFVYGERPVEKPLDLTFELVEEKDGFMEGKAIYRNVNACFSGYKMNFDVTIPKSDTPVPTFVFLILTPYIEDFKKNNGTNMSFFPMEDIIARGYGAASVTVSEIDPDEHDGFKNGVHGALQNPGDRTNSSWGTISAWAWGMSRVIDYLYTLPQVDKNKIATIGHSRGGKTSLWCGANDKRVSLVISNNSGCTGASLTRGKTGENIEKINEVFPHWFCENYKAFGGHEEMLPVDQHMLIALQTPRPVCIGSATEDLWADPPLEMKSCEMASEIYKLYGLKGFIGPAGEATADTPYQQGDISYHLRTGEHKLTEYDWKVYMDFADKYFK